MRPMTASTTRRAVMLAGSLSFAVPMAVAPATAQSPQAPGTTPAATTPAPTATAAAKRTSISITKARRNVTVGRNVLVKGRLKGAGGIRTVALRVRVGGRWVTVDKDRTTRRGAFRLSGDIARHGRMTARVVYPAIKGERSSRRTVGAVNVYRRAFASWYGPGFYGNRTACGGTLGYGTMGVAHKTLPCGTKLTLRKGSRTVRVRVIDRGPFHPGREYDLTGATKRALGFGSTGVVLSTR